MSLLTSFMYSGTLLIVITTSWYWKKKKPSTWTLFGETPQVYLHASMSLQHLLEHVPSLKTFQPALWTWNGHFGTILASYLTNKPTIQYQRQYITTSDGGTISLDWSKPTTNNSANTPTLLILHGLVGNSQESYIIDAVQAANQQHWNVVVFNARGCGNNPLTSPQGYCGAFTSDLRQVVKIVQENTTGSVYAVGYSLGAGILSKYIGEEGKQCSLAGVVVPTFGYKNVDEFYTDGSSGRLLPQVSVPLLCLNALDDPICSSKGIPYEVVEKNPNVIFVTTQCGGHLAWRERRQKSNVGWADRVMMEYFLALEHQKINK